MTAGVLVLVGVLLAGGFPPAATRTSATDQAVEEAGGDFTNRPVHRELTPAILASIPDEDVEQAVFDYAAAKVGENLEHEREVVLGLAPGVRALYVTWLVEGEVNNGGFNQFYWNSAGQFARDAVGAFEFFAARKLAKLMAEANRLRAIEARRIQKLKDEGTIEAFSESYGVSRLGPLDDRFYSLEKDFAKLRVAKIRANPELFSGR